MKFAELTQTVNPVTLQRSALVLADRMTSMFGASETRAAPLLGCLLPALDPNPVGLDTALGRVETLSQVYLSMLLTVLRRFVEAVQDVGTHADQVGKQTRVEGGLCTTKGPRPVKLEVCHNADVPSVKCPVSVIQLERLHEASWILIVVRLEALDMAAALDDANAWNSPERPKRPSFPSLVWLLRTLLLLRGITNETFAHSKTPFFSYLPLPCHFPSSD